jgi:hypothetical protein
VAGPGLVHELPHHILDASIVRIYVVNKVLHVQSGSPEKMRLQALETFIAAASGFWSSSCGWKQLHARANASKKQNLVHCWG